MTIVRGTAKYELSEDEIMKAREEGDKIFAKRVLFGIIRAMANSESSTEKLRKILLTVIDHDRVKDLTYLIMDHMRYADDSIEEDMMSRVTADIFADHSYPF